MVFEPATFEFGAGLLLQGGWQKGMHGVRLFRVHSCLFKLMDTALNET